VVLERSHHHGRHRRALNNMFVLALHSHRIPLSSHFVCCSHSLCVPPFVSQTGHGWTVGVVVGGRGDSFHVDIGPLVTNVTLVVRLLDTAVDIVCFWLFLPVFYDLALLGVCDHHFAEVVFVGVATNIDEAVVVNNNYARYFPGRDVNVYLLGHVRAVDICAVAGGVGG
jgi:hypothetical protein